MRWSEGYAALHPRLFVTFPYICDFHPDFLFYLDAPDAFIKVVYRDRRYYTLSGTLQEPFPVRILRKNGLYGQNHSTQSVFAIMERTGITC